jgi:hypothetical protein
MIPISMTKATPARLKNLFWVKLFFCSIVCPEGTPFAAVFFTFSFSPGKFNLGSLNQSVPEIVYFSISNESFTTLIFSLRHSVLFSAVLCG